MIGADRFKIYLGNIVDRMRVGGAVLEMTHRFLV